MKKLISILTIVMLLLSSSCFVHASEASNSTVSTDIEYFDDGSYMVTTIEESATPRASELTKTGSKTVDYYNSDDELLWRYVLTGKFYVVINVSAECIESTYSYTIYDDNWSLTAHDNYGEANVAYGTATFTKKVLFVTTSTQDIEVALTCDLRANLT